MAQVALASFLLERGAAPSSRVHDLIVCGKVRVNGTVTRAPSHPVDPRTDAVHLRSQRIGGDHPGVMLFHKPRGVLAATTSCDSRPCLTDYVTSPYRSFAPVGALECESSGLVVLTNDDRLAAKLEAPRQRFPATYRVHVHGAVPFCAVDRLHRGVKLEDGFASARVRFIENTSSGCVLDMELIEWRRAVIHRMIEGIGHAVAAVQRIGHGPFRLDGLPPGAVRRLNEREYWSMRQRIGL